jgi:hypothetical protein
MKVTSSASSTSLNQPVIDIKICKSGTANSASPTCITISNILVDTGSYGLRISSSAISNAALLSTPVIAPNSSNQVMECAQFGSGYIWGGIYKVDLQLGSSFALTASNLNIQVGDSTTNGSSNCSQSAGSDLSIRNNLGANGIIGIGALLQDTSSATYYSCTTSGSCATLTPDTSNGLFNPISQLSYGSGTYNNGYVVDFSGTSTTTPSGSTQGVLTYGINTFTNNQPASSAQVIKLNSSLEFTTTYNSSRLTSIVDTGSNALFFNTSAMSACQTDNAFYCGSLTNQTAILSDYRQNSISITFNVSSYDPSKQVQPQLGGSTGSFGLGFDWGLPFFFGKTIYFGIQEQSNSLNQTAPFFMF